MNFQALYETYSKPIYRFAYRLLGDDEEAKDLTQDTFLILHRNMDSGSRIERPKAWIYTVAANLCRDRLRRRKKSLEIMADFLAEQSRSDPKADALSREDVGIVRRSLAKLPERDRVLVLLYQDELTYAEMADATGINKKSIGKFLSRAIAKLAKAINEGDSR